MCVRRRALDPFTLLKRHRPPSRGAPPPCSEASRGSVGAVPVKQALPRMLRRVVRWRAIPGTAEGSSQRNRGGPMAELTPRLHQKSAESWHSAQGRAGRDRHRGSMEDARPVCGTAWTAACAGRRRRPSSAPRNSSTGWMGKTAIRDMARESNSEVIEMTKTYLGDEVEVLGWFRVRSMAEVLEPSHLGDRSNTSRSVWQVEALADWAVELQRRRRRRWPPRRFLFQLRRAPGRQPDATSNVHQVPAGTACSAGASSPTRFAEHRVHRGIPRGGDPFGGTPLLGEDPARRRLPVSPSAARRPPGADIS